MSDVVRILVLVAIGGFGACAYAGRRARRRKRDENARVCVRERSRVRAFEVVARAESLAQLAVLVHTQPAPSTMWEVVAQELEQLSDSTLTLCDASRTFAFLRATRKLADAVRQLDREVARCRSLSVPDGTRMDDEWRFAAARLQEMSVELVVEARFMGIVADVEGC
jgi:hypothetical protein